MTPAEIAAIPVAQLDWPAAYRIVPSRFPPIGPWDRIAEPADHAALAELEGITNPRLRAELETLALIPRERWVSGPGTTPIMSAFAHLNPAGSRFSNGSYGVFYASRELETAIRETAYHREAFLAATRQPPLQLQMRCYSTGVLCPLHDVRGGFPRLHDPDDYSESQAAGGALRQLGAHGVTYDSVRRPGGQCAAVFWPDCLAPCIQGKHLAYAWNGKAVESVLELTEIRLQE